MTRQPMLRLTAIAASISLTLLLGACSNTELVQEETPPAPTTSAEQAEQRLAAVAAERAAIEARYADREVVCYDKFFVNRCLDEAREVRRAALVTQRAIEIEASLYLRRLKVDERDKAIAEADAAYAQEEAKLAAEPPPVKDPAAAALPPPRTKPAESRVRSQQRAQENAANAEKEAAERAANVAAYEERRRKSEERQKEVARRVAEREAKAAQRAAEEAKRANGNGPAPTN
ncbi:hypothetical protein NM04_18085 [Massilia aurea]|uniref:Lipoprotein n=1 Tax=Massilia aurea TaxID=373040 RepID=A0A422QHE7_9BURK|nr:hypothetical protein [Massilia aurea]RNF29389.1 hypothetical protein NM04_18085 [Massilia aurea]